MGRSARRSVAATAVVAWSVMGAGASVFAADPAAATGLEDGSKYAIALATAGVLVVLLLVLRLARIRGEPPAAAPTADPLRTTPGAATTGADDADLPRWRRPSVVAGRFGLSLPSSGRTHRLAFSPASPAETEPAERFVIRYDAVPLVDQPDDVHGRTIDELSAGDEVEVVDRQTLWVHVRTPAGREGWVPAMTLATLDELPPDVWETTVETAAPPPIDDGPPLEVLLEAIVAGRRTQAGSAPAPGGSAAPRPRRTRTPRAATTDAPGSPPRPRRRKAAASEP